MQMKLFTRICSLFNDAVSSSDYTGSNDYVMGLWAPCSTAFQLLVSVNTGFVKVCYTLHDGAVQLTVSVQYMTIEQRPKHVAYLYESLR
jgi:hypothetical protein